MSKQYLPYFAIRWLVYFMFGAMPLIGNAAEQANQPPERAPREIFVPFSDLHILLEQQPKRVLLDRREFDDLVKKAKKSPESHAPLSAAIVAADYLVTAQQQRAEIKGVFMIDVLAAGLHMLPLDISGVGLQNATVDKRNAAIGRNEAGCFQLFVEGIGRHELSLDMIAPLETTVARQILNFHLPRPAATKLHLAVPGNVEVKGGVKVVSRVFDENGKSTQFELLPQEGDTSILLTLNSHLQRQQQSVVARSVLIDEVTQAYEKLHATVSLGILYRAVDQFRFVVPEGFEITEATSPLLARWDVRQEADRKVLHVKLREQTAETVVLKITAVRTPSQLTGWRAPRLEPLDVVGGVAVLGLLVEDRLKAESLATQGLIPIDTAVLSQALPSVLFDGGLGSPSVRAVAAWYAPQCDFMLAAEYKKPPAEMAVTSSLLLVVADKGQEVFGGLSLLPQAEKRFFFDVSTPVGWQITSVTAAGGQPLTFEHHADRLSMEERSNEAERIRISVPAGIPAGNEFKVNFRATRTPPGWLASWQSSSVAFPRFAVLGATRDEGAIAVQLRDDMTVRPDKLAQLTPLDAAEKSKYGMTDVPTTLAYRYESPKYSASLVVERTKPRLTARTFSFFRVDADALNCHYELIYTIEEARTQRLALLLPKSSPTSVAITALDGVKLKEFTSETIDQQRCWNVLLAEPKRDRVRLAVDFRQPLPSQDPKAFAVPMLLADGVSYQSGLMAVEGCAELDVRVDTPARRVDVGELADADYQPGRRLLGAYGFVGNATSLKIDVMRHPGYGLYPTIVEECSLDTNLSPGGQCQTQARFKLRTKSVYLQVKLPGGAELWSAELDGMPLKPQRQGDGVLIDVPAGAVGASQNLQIVYASLIDPVSFRGTVAMFAPKLQWRAERGKEIVEVPLADLVWRLHLPNGYTVVHAGGNVATKDIERPLPAAVQVASAMYYLTGGICGPVSLLPWPCAAKLSRPTAKSAVAKGNIQVARNAGPASSSSVEEIPMFAIDAPDPKAAEAPKSERLAEGAEKSKTDDGFIANLVEVDKASIPFAGDSKEANFPDAAAWQKLSERRAEKKNAAQNLAGVRSLKINLIQSSPGTERVLTFRSLGVEPLLIVTLTNQSQLGALAWGLALAVGLYGAAITRRSVRKKAEFILVVAVITTLIPMATDSIELAELCNMLFYTACLLVPYYLLAAVVRWLFGLCCQACARCASKLMRAPVLPTVVLLMLLAGTNSWVFAAEADRPATAGPNVVPTVEPAGPVNVPEDAIILPYDPNAWTGIDHASKLLVPYDKYVELWNRAHPDKKIEKKAPPATHSFAGASYRTTLEGDEYLSLTGQMEIELFVDEFVQIPLCLGGGVLTRAELDGTPARLSAGVVSPEPLERNSESNPLAQALNLRALDRSRIVLHVSGKGRHKLELAVRLKLSRQGGWRVVEGVLPVAPATALMIRVPRPQTELRLGQVSDRRGYETEKPDETINTAMDANGLLSIRWRPKVSEGQVDQSLTAVSRALLDVQEDGLRLTWQLNLEFRRSQRQRFHVALPADFLLEKVEGNNVRGWEIRKTDNGQTVEIELLQAAKDREQFTLRLWRAGTVGQGPLAQFPAPTVSVIDAVLNNGQLTIRRSPLLDLQTLDRSGVTRTDLPGEAASAAGGLGSDESPLGIRPFESYSFAAVPFTVRLAATAIAARCSAAVQTVLRIAEYERSLESRVLFNIQGRPAYQLQMLLPDDLHVDQVSAPGEYQYTVTRKGNRPLLTIYLATGQQGNVPVVIRGKLGREGQVKELSLPQLDVVGVDRQQGDIAVQVDPAFDVDTAGLKNCDRVLLGQLNAWLNPEQRRVTRLGLHYLGGDYSGILRLALRKADVVSDTISNVRVTDRAVEETIMLDFTIKNAGVRELSFLLPAGMSGCRISVPMLRQKSITPVGKDLLRISIELQDEVMDQLRILVENDRLLTPGSHEAPIPTVELGRTNRRYVSIESVGRDPVKVEEDALREMNSLERRQAEWKTLAGILGREMTLAYLVSPDAHQPRLSFHTEMHAAVKTVGARIGLAETTLVLDGNGVYRARQLLRLDNATEQFLEIRLPDGAELWTVQVAGEPVKPTRLPEQSDRHGVRIPLIKTAPGDLYYEVSLKYGGKMPSLGTLDNIAFPLIHCQNIRPDLSQVRLYVPDEYRWFNFAGTMRPVAEEADLSAGYVKFQTKQTEQIMAALQQGDKWAKIRAAANLKTQQATMDQYRSSMQSARSSSELQSELSANAGVMQQARQEVDTLEKAPPEADLQDNREQLNKMFQGQKLGRARNVVNDVAAQWGAAEGQKTTTTSGTSREIFNERWLAENKLNARSEQPQGAKGIVSFGSSSGFSSVPVAEEMGRSAGPPSSTPSVTGKTTSADTTRERLKPQSNLQQQPTPTQIIQEEEEERIPVQAGQQAAPAHNWAQTNARKDSDSAQRYKERLERQSGQLKFGVGVNSDSGLAGSVVLDEKPLPSNRPQPPAGWDTNSAKPQDGSTPPSPPAKPQTAIPQEVYSSDIDGRKQRDNASGGSPSVAQPQPTGLASLDFVLPTRGTLYRFTTPQGEVEITATAFSSKLFRRLIEIAIAAVAALIVWFVVNRIDRSAFHWLATPPGSTALVCLGLLSLCGGVMPILGLAALVTGAGMKIRCKFRSDRSQNVVQPKQ